jgi:hypothetical protein
MSLEDQLQQMQRQLAHLIDKDAIRERMDRYVFLLDAARWDDIATEIFTEDAVARYLPNFGDAGEPRGREQIREFFGGMTMFAGTQHLLGSVRIEVDGDEATSLTHALASHWFDSESPQPANYTAAVGYDDKWRRTDAGWLIYERQVFGFGKHGLVFGEIIAAPMSPISDVYGARDR